MEPRKVESGNPEGALAAAPHRVDLTFRTPRHNYNSIELHAVTLFWSDDELYVHDSTQGVAGSTWTLGEVFGLSEGKVHLSSPYVGGGFGGKTLWHHHILAAAASKLAGMHVRLVLSREGMFRMVGGRTTTKQRVAIGSDAEGRFLSLIHSGTAAMTQHNNVPEQFTFPARHLYGAKNFLIWQRVADMDMLASTFMRAPGESIGTFALECAIDELAEQLGVDPIELRLRNEQHGAGTADIR